MREVKNIIGEMLDQSSRQHADIEKMVNRIIERMGGPDMVAQEFVNLISDSSTQKFIKQKAMSDLLRLITQVQDKYGKPLDMSTIATQDLEALAADIVQSKYAAQATKDRPGVDTARLAPEAERFEPLF